MRRARNTRCLVHVETDVFVADQRRLARVQPHPHSECLTVFPRVGGECSLGGRSRLARVDGARKDAEKRITFGSQLVTFIALKGRPEHLVVVAAASYTSRSFSRGRRHDVNG